MAAGLCCAQNLFHWSLTKVNEKRFSSTCNRQMNSLVTTMKTFVLIVKQQEPKLPLGMQRLYIIVNKNETQLFKREKA